MQKKKKKKTSKLSQYRRNTKAIIKRAVESGYGKELMERLKTFDVNELVKSKKGHEKVKNTMQAIRERRNIFEKEFEKVSNKQIDEIRKEYGQRGLNRMRRDKVYKKLSLFVDYKDKKYDINELRSMIQEMKNVNGLTHYKNMMSGEVNDFFDDYFKELKLNNSYKEMIQDMKEFFVESEGLANFYDFCDYISSDNFKGKYYPDKRDVDDYEAMMIDRLHRAMDAMINNTYL